MNFNYLFYILNIIKINSIMFRFIYLILMIIIKMNLIIMFKINAFRFIIIMFYYCNYYYLQINSIHKYHHFIII